MAYDLQKEIELDRYIKCEKSFLSERVERAEKCPDAGCVAADEILTHAEMVVATINQLSQGLREDRVGNPGDLSDNLIELMVSGSIDALTNYARSTGDWKACTSLFMRAYNLTRAESIKNSIATRMHKCGTTPRVENLRAICWVCKAAPSDVASAQTVMMCGHAQVNGNGPVVQWNTKEIYIPRCAWCAQKEKKEKALLLEQLGNSEIEMARLENSLAYRLFKTKNSAERHSELANKYSELVSSLQKLEHYDYPEVDDLLKKGWHIGDRPPRSISVMGFDFKECLSPDEFKCH